MEDSAKVFPLISLLVLVLGVSSLFNLIDTTEGAAASYSPYSSSSPYHVYSFSADSPSQSRIQAEDNQVQKIALALNSSRTTTTTTTTDSNSNSNSKSSPSSSPSTSSQAGTTDHDDHREDEKKERHFFVAPNQGKKKKKKTTVSPKISPSKDVVSEKMDEGEFFYTFDNGTQTDEQEAATAAGRQGANVMQSTLPAMELILACVVHLMAFVVFLYLWRAAYFEIEDPYATPSPYGFPVTPVPSKGRELQDNLDSYTETLQKSIDMQ